MSSTLTPTPSTTATAEAAGPLLNAMDRCDGCGGQAYVKAILDVDFDGHESSLLFCGHHWTKHKAKVLPLCLAHHDETDLLYNPQPKTVDGSAFA